MLAAAEPLTKSMKARAAGVWCRLFRQIAGDLGAIVAHHGRVYGEEYGVDSTFEGHVASSIARAAIRGFPSWREPICLVGLDGEQRRQLQARQLRLNLPQPWQVVAVALRLGQGADRVHRLPQRRQGEAAAQQVLRSEPERQRHRRHLPARRFGDLRIFRRRR